MNERQIFEDALAIDRSEDLQAFLIKACGGDRQLIAHIEDLIKAQQKLGSFLELTPDQLRQTVGDSTHNVALDTQIGPYKLLELIGEGGMGTVYMAEQTEPVKRRVALKLIKTGMDTKQVIARFEAERQALAMMDHPNIAKVLDAGETDSGRPYFVMELVKGLPINQHCDENQLNTRQRLELFGQACRGVQHAHQKGIIHRDLKPTNVLIAMYDDKPVPKIIDFGVAKATGDQISDGTLFTHFGQVVGTLSYMSPEQGQLNQLDVDTRTDIYSLGAVLYELLSGEPPFDRERLKKGALDEVLRMIREEEPEKPSSRLSTSKSAAQTSASRRSNPQKLSSLIRGDLDWIVMMALEKDRTRRYETANELASDINRYLGNEPVLAGPPSATYRFRKFARRNTGKLVAVSIIATLLILGTVVSAWQAVRATTAEKIAKNEAVRATNEAEEAARQVRITKEVQNFWNIDVLGQARPDKQANRDITLRQVLNLASEGVEGKFENDPLVEAAIRSAIYPALTMLGETEKVLAHRKRNLSIYESQLGPLHEETLNEKQWLGLFYLNQGLFDLAQQFLEETFAESKRHLGPTHIVTLDSLTNLGILNKRLGNYEVAFRMFDEARRGYILKFGHGDVHTIRAMQNCSVVLSALDKENEARELWVKALALSLENLGPKHPQSLALQSNLAASFNASREYHKALQEYQLLVPIQRQVLGDKSRAVLITSFGFAKALWKTGNLSEAEKVLLENYEIHQKFHPTDPMTVLVPVGLVALYAETEREEDATRVFDEVLRANLDAQSRVNFAAKLRYLTNELLEEGRLDPCGYLCDRCIECLQSVTDPDLRNQVIASLNKLIVLLNNLNDKARIVSAHEFRIKTIELNSDGRPGDDDNAVRLGGYYCDLGTVLSKNERTQDALASYNKAKKLLGEVLAKNNDHILANKFFQGTLFMQAQTMSRVERYQDAIKIFDRLLVSDLKHVNKAHVLISKARVLALAGQHQSSVDLINSLAATERVDEDDLFVASVFAIASGAASTDPNLSPGEREELSNKHAEHSVELLEAAVKTANLTVAQLEELKDDEDFSAVRERREYTQLVELVDSKISKKRKFGDEKKISVTESTNDNDEFRLPHPDE